MSSVFVIEDDRAFRSELAHLLELQGYQVLTPTAFETAAQAALAAQPSCIVLDLKLPGVDGHSLCRDIRRESTVPIIVLTSSDNEFDEVMALNLGADDFLTKPCGPAKLLAHIQAALRRSARGHDIPTLSVASVTLDPSLATVAYQGKSVELTRNELRILHLLMANPDTIISRQEIMGELWDSDEFIDDNTLTVNVNRLRKKLSELGVPESFLVTRRGLGYSVSSAAQS